MPPLNPTFNPGQVMLNPKQSPIANPIQSPIVGPYTPGTGTPKQKPIGTPVKPIGKIGAGGVTGVQGPQLPFGPRQFGPPQWGGGPAKPQPMQQNPGQTYGAQSVRSTGSGPYDPAYRQNLATYAGGLFNRPGGNLSFNPTDPNSLQGNPSGGGNAPVMGTPTSLLAQALGTSPNSTQAPAQNTAPLSSLSMQNWLQNFMSQYMNGKQQ